MKKYKIVCDESQMKIIQQCVMGAKVNMDALDEALALRAIIANPEVVEEKKTKAK